MAKNHDKGYIKVHRSILDNPIWTSEERFDQRSAWIDMILMANYADKVRIEHNSSYTLQRGQFTASRRQLAVRWHWSKNTVSKFLKMLQNEGMIWLDVRTHNYTLVTIVNYGVYQDSNKPTRDTDWDTDRDTDWDTVGDTEWDNHKKDKESIKKEKKKPVSDPGGKVYEE